MVCEVRYLNISREEIKGMLERKYNVDRSRIVLSHNGAKLYVRSDRDWETTLLLQ